jgi:hypothetical protein
MQTESGSPPSDQDSHCIAIGCSGFFEEGSGYPVIRWMLGLKNELTMDPGSIIAKSFEII